MRVPMQADPRISSMYDRLLVDAPLIPMGDHLRSR